MRSLGSRSSIGWTSLNNNWSVALLALIFVVVHVLIHTPVSEGMRAEIPVMPWRAQIFQRNLGRTGAVVSPLYFARGKHTEFQTRFQWQQENNNVEQSPNEKRKVEAEFQDDPLKEHEESQEELELQIEQLFAERAALLERYPPDERKHRVEQLNQEKLKLINELQDYRMKKHKTEEYCQQKIEVLKEQQEIVENNHEFSDEDAELERNLEKMENENASFREKVGRFEKERKKQQLKMQLLAQFWQEQGKEFNTTKASLESKLRELQKEKEGGFEKANEKQQEMIQLLAQQWQEVSNEVNSTRVSLERRLRMLETENVSFKKQVGGFEKENEKQQERIQLLTQQWQEENEEANNTRISLEKKLKKLAKENANLKEQVEGLEKESEQQQQKIKVLKRHWQEESEDFIDTTGSLQQRLQKTRDELLSVEKDRQEQQEKMQVLSKQLEEERKKFNKTISSLHEQLQMSQDELVSVQKERQELHDRYQKVQAELSRAAAEWKDRFESEQASFRDIRDASQRQLQDLHISHIKALGSLREELAQDYEDQLRALKAQCDYKDETLGYRKAALIKLRKDIGAHQASLERMREERSSLRALARCAWQVVGGRINRLFDRKKGSMYSVDELTTKSPWESHGRE